MPLGLTEGSLTALSDGMNERVEGTIPGRPDDRVRVLPL